MDVRKITDDQILEYLMGEVSSSEMEKWDHAIELNPSLQERVKTLAFIKEEVSHLPEVIHGKENGSYLSLAKAVAFGFFLFVAGIWVEGHFSFYKNTVDDLKSGSIEVSKELNWNESSLNNVM